VLSLSLLSFLVSEGDMGEACVSRADSVRTVARGVTGLSDRAESFEWGMGDGAGAGEEAGSGSDSESASASRRFPGQYRSSSSISNAPPGFITRIISSNNASHCGEH
jgi:hypothetical protein